MYEFSFLPFLLVRQPSIEPDNWDEQHLSVLLNQDLFRSAIWLASPGFFKELSKYSFNYERLPASVRLSLLRYLNRMVYRATPFGLFASFALASWEGEKNRKPDEEAKLHLIPDFRISLRTANSTPDADSMYVLNSSVYKAGRLYRFLSRDGISFRLNSFAPSELINSLILFLGTARRLNEILLYLHKQDLSEEESVEFFQSFKASGIVASAIDPNITGELYARRLNRYPFSLRMADPYINPESLKEIAGALSPDEQGSPLYAIYERREEDSLASKLQTQLHKGINALKLLAPSQGQKDLDAFKERFQKRYDRQEVPLLMALDPEYGLGYGFEDSLDQHTVIKDIVASKTGIEEFLCWSSANKLLFRILAGSAGGIPIVLNSEDLAGLKDDKTENVPPSMSVLFSIRGNKTIIESAGGANAMALAARFSAVNEELEEKLRSIAREEESWNPDIVFAEIAFCPYDHSANINTRPNFYSYEIPVLTSSLMPRENQISLNDLMISIREGKLVLRSVSLNKQVIPRLSSAYNPAASSLSVFRLLYDLQYQGLASFGFHLPSIFPGLNFYPRIEFENNVLALAIWRLNEAEVMEILNSLNALSAWHSIAASRGIPPVFRIGQSDRTLLIDIRKPLSLELLWSELKKGKAMLLTEVFADKDQDLDAKDMKQYVAFIPKKETTYSASISAPFITSKKVKRNFFPANKWLYFKIYLSQDSANQVLLKTIRPLIRKLHNQGLIDAWFFIRYLDPDFHVRLRLKVRKNTEAKVLAGINNHLEPLYKAGLMHQVQMASYERELERYGDWNIENVEHLFQCSSELTLQLLGLPEANDILFLLRLTLVLMEDIISFLPEKEREELIYFQYQAFFKEFGGDKKLRIAMDKQFRKHAIKPADLQRSEELLKSGSLKKYWQKWVEARSKLLSSNLCSDLIHLQINRLFSRDQRKYEMILYYFLWKMNGSTSYLISPTSSTA